MKKEKEIIHEIKKFQFGIVDNIEKQMREQSKEELSQKAYEGEGDICYKIDKNVDKPTEKSFSRFADVIGSCALISEGAGKKLYGTKKIEDCEYVIILDPIDGTRGLMYDMRPAWTLAAVALNKLNPTLNDIEIAVQTEIPITKQHKFDSFVGIKGKGTTATRYNVIKEQREWKPQPSKAKSIAHGFAFLTKFFEGAKTETSEIEEELFKRLSLFEKNRALTFDDQYISSGGQFAMLINGSYRFCGDLRPFFSEGLCAHPYDVCTKLIATEIGVEITDPYGRDLNTPLNTTKNVAWLGYANKDIRKQVEPVLLEILEEKIPNIGEGY